MKKKIIISLLGLAIVILVMVSLWPLSFSRGIAVNTELWVQIIDVAIENGMPNNSVNDYRFRPDSEGFEQIQQILNKYSFRRSFRTFFGDAELNGRGVNCWLFLFSGERNILIGDKGVIIVNNSVYRIGYGGNKKTLELMSEIRSVVEQ